MEEDIILPMFNLPDQPQAQSVVKSVPSEISDAVPAVAKLEALEKASPIKMIRKVGSGFTPSIKDALAGNVAEKPVVVESQKPSYSEYGDYSEPFTYGQFASKWAEFLDQLTDRPNLRSTLVNTPELTDGNKILLKIGNSVQEEEVRVVKLELISWLRRELRNSGIELITRIEKTENERVFYSDSEKLQMMMQKNPELYELKQKFNLDFKD